MKVVKLGKLKKGMIIVSFILMLYGCGEKELTRMEELESMQKEQDQQGSSEQQETKNNTNVDTHNNESETESTDSAEKDNVVLIDEDNLLNGYWLIVDMEGERDKVSLNHEGKLMSVELLHIDESVGELLDVEYGYIDKELSDFIIKKNDSDKTILEGIGQVFEEHWNHDYSIKTEIAFKPIND